MVLEKFCFCCKLQKGAFIWSILSIIFFFIVFVTTLTCGLLIGNETNRTELYWTLLVSSAIHFISSILLCIGVRKRNHYVMLPWVIVNSLYLVPFAFLALIGLIAAVPIVGPIYIWWCICSYYLRIRDDRTLFFQLVFEANP